MENNINESLKREAYQKALQFKNTGLEVEAIYARLEKQGYPPELAMEVARNVIMKKVEDNENKAPSPINSFSVWSKLLRTLFPNLKI